MVIRDMSEHMRPVVPVDLPNLAPADLSGVDEPMLEWLEKFLLLIDGSYQRDISAPSLRVIRAMVEGWDWLRYTPIIVAMTERGFEVVDGQHRAIAACCHPGITKLPCFVIDGTTLPERARAFVSHGRDRLAVTAGQVHRAEVAAGDVDALAIDAVCRAAGVRILATSPAFGARYEVGDTTAIASIRALIARRGQERATEILRALVRAGLAPIVMAHVRASEVLCFEQEYAAEFGPEQLTNALLSLGTSAVPEVKALAAAKGLPVWRAWVAVLFKHRKARARAGDPAPSAPESSPVRTPTAAHASSAVAGPAPHPMRRVIDRRPATNVVSLGEPAPGRSALDQRRAGA